MTIPGLRIGRYEVGERLGKGGFGVVHLAYDNELGREVAIKFLRPEYMTREQVVGRFLQEARACAKIGHPGIVTVFEAGVVSGTSTRVDGTAYIVMERLTGESLGARLKKGGRMSAIAAIGIARQLAAALAVAHEAGIIHRDLKPDNVYLVRDAAVVGGERVKILDFGVAKLADPDETEVHTHSRMMLGTPRYMSPEQARAAGKVDLRTDIYALGCLLYELVCGQPPFGGDIGDIIVAHQTAPITPPRELVTSIPAALDSLIVQMLAKEPEHRPDSMRSVDVSLDTVFASLAPKKRAPTDVDDEKTTRKVLPGELLDQPMPTPVTLVTTEAPTVVRLPPMATGGIARDGGRRALVIRVAIGLGAAVISGLIVYLILRGNEPERVVARVDAALPRSPDAAIVVATDAALADAIDVAGLETACKTAVVDKQWTQVADCGRALANAGSPDGQRYVGRATAEAKAEVSLRQLRQSLDASDLKTATAALAEIPESSVYHAQATTAYAAAKAPIVDSLVAELDGYTQAHECTRHAARLRAFEQKYGAKLAEEGRLIARVCKGNAPPPPLAGSATPLDACDPKTVAEVEQRADGDFISGAFGTAAPAFEMLVKCKPALLSKAYLANCRAHRFPQAKKLFQQLDPGRQTAMAQICMKEGYDPRSGN